jgi:hypothetical protein
MVTFDWFFGNVLGISLGESIARGDRRRCELWFGVRRRRSGALGKSKSARKEKAVRLRRPEGLNYCDSTTEPAVVF